MLFRPDEPSDKSLPLPTGQTAERIRAARTPIAVLGYGISNRPLVRILQRMGVDVDIYDQNTVDSLGDEAREAQAGGARFHQSLQDMQLASHEVIFRSPGIRPDTPEFLQAKAAGAYFTSEMTWFFEATPATILGITGSDGKTTTTTLTSLFLRQVYGEEHVFLGGNIGAPLLPRVGLMHAGDFAVVELSSFQLYDMPLSPERAAITNLSPNHLNWHADMNEYTESKANIFRGVGCRRLITNADNEICVSLVKACPPGMHKTLFSSRIGDPAAFFARYPDCDGVLLRDGSILYCTPDGTEEELLRTDDILLPGWYNRENVMTAAALCRGLVSPEHVRAVTSTFRGVEHRMEYVRTVRGVRYYNGSIDSSPTRTAAALSALEGPVVVICGGYDKHIPFAPLAKALCARAKAVILTGATAGMIEEALHACPDFPASHLAVRHAPLFRDAVELAAATAEEGDTVLLSPACASFDAFRNFEERGETFKAIVRAFPE